MGASVVELALVGMDDVDYSMHELVRVLVREAKVAENSWRVGIRQAGRDINACRERERVEFWPKIKEIINLLIDRAQTN